jgi:xanthine dehydrogenase FAD-binding subunit
MVNGYQPVSLKDALNILNENDVTIYAGGTDIMVHKKKPATYLFVNRIPEMRSILMDDHYIRIGSAVTFSEMLSSSLIPRILKDAVGKIAAPGIRNLGTIGGNIGNASAKADSVVILYVMDAKLRIADINGERIINIDEFYMGNKKTNLSKNELIVEILLPKKEFLSYYYKKVGGREALSISRISFAGIFQMNNNIISKISIAFGAVSDTVLRFKDIEAMLIGKTPEEAKELKADFIGAYESTIVPAAGRVSSAYRKQVCINLLEVFFDLFVTGHTPPL